MTENQKRVAIVVVIFLVILLLLLRGGRGATILNSGELPGIISPGGSSISIPGRTPFVIPDFGPRPANNLSAIGACCADCSGRSQVQSYVPASRGLTIVNNAGSSGPNVFNYITQTTTQAAPVPTVINPYPIWRGK